MREGYSVACIFIVVVGILSICCGVNPPSTPSTEKKCAIGDVTWVSSLPVLSSFSYGPAGCVEARRVYSAGREFEKHHEAVALGSRDGEEYSGRFTGVSFSGEVFESEEVRFRGTSRETGGVLQITSIDVGWGDAHFLALPGGNLVLIDCGSRKHLDKLREFLDEHVWSSPFGSLKALVLTHPHEDHIGGALGDTITGSDGVLESYPVDQLLLPEVDPAEFPLLQSIVNKAKESGVPVRFLSEGENSRTNPVTLGWEPGFDVTVLNSGSRGISENPNNLSLVLKMSWGVVDFLFTGDAEEEVERSLLFRYAGSDFLSCEILKLSHHGSADANSPPFIEAVLPRVALLSVDSKEVAWTLPDRDVLAALDYLFIDLFTTDSCGCDGSDISVLTDGKFIEVSQ